MEDRYTKLRTDLTKLLEEYTGGSLQTRAIVVGPGSDGELYLNLTLDGPSMRAVAMLSIAERKVK